jgi:hypothetical protein
MTHAFFVAMGGFAYEDEQSKLHVITVESLFDTNPEDQDMLTNPKHINPDSVIPAYDNVPGAPLRPGLRRNVVEGTENLPIIDLIALVREEDIIDKSKGDGLSKLVAMVQVIWFIIQCISRLVLRLSVTELETITAAYATMNLMVYMMWWKKPLRVDQQIILYSLHARADLPESGDASEEPEGVPSDEMDLKDFAASLWRSLIGLHETRSDKVGLLWAGTNTLQNVSSLLSFTFLMAFVFGAIHCAAWRNAFPTNAEKWLWESSSIVITCVPILLSAIIALAYVPESFIPPTLAFLLHLALITFNVLPVLYSICRIILLVLPLIQLRSLPPDAFIDISWSSFIPHI